MLEFLSTPYLLLGAAAASLPIIIHLVHRNRAETVQFAAMRFLAATPSRLLRRQKLKQILLLALRVLALLILGFIFARPLLVGHPLDAWLGDEPVANAIVVDVSASMAAQDHLKSASQAAAGIISAARDHDRFWIIAFGIHPEILVENATPAQASQALHQLRQRQSIGEMREAVQFGDNLLSQSPLQRRKLYLISDLQTTNLTAGNLALTSLADFIPVDLSSTWQNVAILDGDQVLQNGQPVYVCRVRSFTEMNQEIEVRLFSNSQTGHAAASKRVTLNAMTEKIVRFPPAEASAHVEESSLVSYFEIQVPVDDFEADNRFYLSPTRDRNSRFLVISERPEGDFFLKHALELPEVPYRVFYATANSLDQFTPHDFDVVLLIGPAGMNRGAAAWIRNYVEQGGGLIVACDGHPATETFNHLLADLLPARILEIRHATAAGHETLTLSNIDFAHPIFQVFQDPQNGDPSSIQISRYYRVKPHSAALQIAAYEDGAPALLELGVGKGKVLLWTSTLDLTGGNLPVRSIFVPILHQWIEYVRRPIAPTTVTHVGQPIFLADEFQADAPVRVTLPDGTERRVQAPAALSYGDTEAPGLYQFRQGPKAVWRAVNLDARESDPAAFAPDDLLARFNQPDAGTRLSSILGSSAPSLVEQERQQKLWRMALWVLFAILLGEIWLANRTPR